VDKIKTRVMQGLNRVDFWLDENIASIVAPAALEAHHQALKTSIARAKTYAAQQDARFAVKVITAKDQKAFHVAIMAQLRDIAQLARQLRKTIPGIGALVAPKAVLGATNFLRRSESFMEKASIYAQPLIEHGMSPDFMTTIRAELMKFETAFTTRAAAKSDQVTATASLTLELRNSRGIVEIIDVGVKRALRKTDPGKLAGWVAAKRAMAGRTTSAEQVTITPPSIETV